MHRSIALWVSLLFPALASAHGNVGGEFTERLLHVLTTAEHLWGLAMLILAVIFARRIHLRLRWHRNRTAQQGQTPKA